MSFAIASASVAARDDSSATKELSLYVRSSRRCFGVVFEEFLVDDEVVVEDDSIVGNNSCRIDSVSDLRKSSIFFAPLLLRLQPPNDVMDPPDLLRSHVGVVGRSWCSLPLYPTTVVAVAVAVVLLFQ